MCYGLYACITSLWAFLKGLYARLLVLRIHLLVWEKGLLAEAAKAHMHKTSEIAYIDSFLLANARISACFLKGKGECENV